MGPRVVTVFLNGACADITQVDNRSLNEPEFGEKYSRLVGTRVGAEVLKVLATTERGGTWRVAARSRCLRCSRRPLAPATVEAARAIAGQDPASHPDLTAWTFAKERVLLDYLAQKEPVVSVEVQALQIGPAVYLANPAEYFCSFGLDIKKRSPFPLTFVVELANGGVGYVPDADAFSPAGGGYETVLTSYSSLEPGAGQAIADASVELAAALQPGPLPATPRVQQPGQPWSYGVLGPELQ